LSDVELHDFSIFKALDKLNRYKSPGSDGLHPRILFETRNVISIPLKIIFEASMRMKQLPKDWTNANICAVHKKEISQICQTIYPPVSLTSTPCKIIKGLTRDHLMKHFTDNNLFNNNQYGFLKGRSTML